MKNILIISNLGTISGINELLKILGKSYIFPKISFFSLDYGMFRPEDSHFVLHNASITKENNTLHFNSNNRNMEISFTNSLDSKYFNGNKLGTLKYDDSICYIEFSTEDYFIEIYFNKDEFDSHFQNISLNS